MLMDEGENSSKARPRRLLFWVTFLFCFCFIISVYAPLNSLRLLPSPPQFTQQNIEKLSSTALEPQRIGKIKQKKNCLLFTEAGKKPQFNSDGLKHDKNNNVSAHSIWKLEKSKIFST